MGGLISWRVIQIRRNIDHVNATFHDGTNYVVPLQLNITPKISENAVSKWIGFMFAWDG